MATSLNRWTGIGNLGQDPEIRSTPNGAQVASFRLACAESWKDQSGQKHERVEWVSVVAWRKLAEICQKYLRKGSQIYVEGKLQTRSWDDKNGGGKRYTTEIIADEIKMLGGRPESRPGERTSHRDDDMGDDREYQRSFDPHPAEDDDTPLPF